MKVYWIILFIGYVRPNTYTLITPAKSWNDSRTICINKGMDLVVIRDNDVMTEVRDYIKTVNKFTEDVWIGLTWNEFVLCFYWVNNKILSWLVDKPPWKLDEPNCMEKTCKEETVLQHCVRMTNGLLEWRTHACNNKHVALCQRLSSTTIDVPTSTESVTTDLSITVQSTTTSSPTITDSVTTDLSTSFKSTRTNLPNTTGLSSTSEASATESPTTPKSTIAKMSQESKQMQSQNQLRTELAITKRSTNTTQTSTIVSTELPRIVTTEFITINTESSFNASTEYITNGTFFNNCTQKCRCKSVSNEVNTPQENYRIDKRKTSAYIRRHSSAYDGRLSSRIIGYTGAAVICTVVLVVISFDIINLMKRNEANK